MIYNHKYNMLVITYERVDTPRKANESSRWNSRFYERCGFMSSHNMSRLELTCCIHDNPILKCVDKVIEKYRAQLSTCQVLCAVRDFHYSSSYCTCLA